MQQKLQSWIEYGCDWGGSCAHGNHPQLDNKGRSVVDFVRRACWPSATDCSPSCSLAQSKTSPTLLPVLQLTCGAQTVLAYLLAPW